MVKIRNPQQPGCPICNLEAHKCAVLAGGFRAYRDDFPARPGQTLVFPCWHVSDFSQLAADERKEFLAFRDQIATALKIEFQTGRVNCAALGDGDLTGCDHPIIHAQQERVHLYFLLTPRPAGDDTPFVVSPAWHIGELPHEMAPLRTRQQCHVLGLDLSKLPT